MKFLTNLLYNLKLNKLYRQLKKRHINKRFHNFDTAKKVGIIFNTKEDKNQYLLEDLKNFLKQKNIQITTFFYVPTKKNTENFETDYLLTLEDVSWLGCPKNEKIKDFLEEKFDILILLAEKEDFILHYIFALANAELKVSPHYQNLNFADLTFSLKEHHSLETFVESVKTYLIDIKPNK